MSRPIPPPREWLDDRERIASRRLWASMMLALHVDAFDSIVARRPVLAASLDAFVLRHALRGARLPRADAYVEVTDEMLDAIAEAELAIVSASKGQP